MEGRKIDKACRFALAQRASYHGDSNMHPDCTLVRGGGSRESAHHAGGFSDAKPSECCCVAYASAASLLECWNGAHITIAWHRIKAGRETIYPTRRQPVNTEEVSLSHLYVVKSMYK